MIMYLPRYRFDRNDNTAVEHLKILINLVHLSYTNAVKLADALIILVPTGSYL